MRMIKKLRDFKGTTAVGRGEMDSGNGAGRSADRHGADGWWIGWYIPKRGHQTRCRRGDCRGR